MPSTAIAADADAVWSALDSTVDRASSRPGVASYSKLVGCANSTSSGPRPLADGSTIPGFRVTVAVPPAELVLTGHHHFSTYTPTRTGRRTRGHVLAPSQIRPAPPTR